MKNKKIATMALFVVIILLLSSVVVAAPFTIGGLFSKVSSFFGGGVTGAVIGDPCPGGNVDCELGEVCSSAGVCAPDSCGDVLCDFPEDDFNCPEDCFGPDCGDGFCETH